MLNPAPAGCHKHYLNIWQVQKISMLPVDPKLEPKVKRAPLGQIPVIWVAQLVQVHLSAVALTYQSLSYNFKSDLNQDTTKETLII